MAPPFSHAGITTMCPTTKSHTGSRNIHPASDPYHRYRLHLHRNANQSPGISKDIACCCLGSCPYAVQRIHRIICIQLENHCFDQTGCCRAVVKCHWQNFVPSVSFAPTVSCIPGTDERRQDEDTAKLGEAKCSFETQTANFAWYHSLGLKNPTHVLEAFRQCALAIRRPLVRQENRSSRLAWETDRGSFLCLASLEQYTVKEVLLTGGNSPLGLIG
jgi:hypothetical protein